MLWTACDSRLGIWSIDASYSDDFTTTARTDFEVKEYGMEYDDYTTDTYADVMAIIKCQSVLVLPSFSIFLEPEANYISYGSFNRFSFKVSAR